MTTKRLAKYLKLKKNKKLLKIVYDIEKEKIQKLLVNEPEDEKIENTDTIGNVPVKEVKSKIKGR